MSDSTGQGVWSGEASPFGEKVEAEGAAVERLKYTGKDLDPETGLYYFNARWYDASLGRFTTEDPARSGLAWYAYANNNPLRFIDPTGLFRTEKRESRGYVGILEESDTVEGFDLQKAFKSGFDLLHLETDPEVKDKAWQKQWKDRLEGFWDELAEAGQDPLYASREKVGPANGAAVPSADEMRLIETVGVVCYSS